MMVTQRTVSFKMLSHVCASTCIPCIIIVWEKTKGKFPGEHHIAGLEIKKMSGRKFATSYENLVTTLKMLVAKLIEAI